MMFSEFLLNCFVIGIAVSAFSLACLIFQLRKNHQEFDAEQAEINQFYSKQND